VADVEPTIRVQPEEGVVLTHGLYYVRKVILGEVQGSIAAFAVLIPWSAFVSDPDTALEVKVAFYKGGLNIPSLSQLNYLLLQGTRVGLEESNDHGWFLRAIETLQGTEFRAALRSEYKVRRAPKT